jgi:hypothetical protein
MAEIQVPWAVFTKKLTPLHNKLRSVVLKDTLPKQKVGKTIHILGKLVF